MPIFFYNTLTRKKEEFEPITKGEVKIYTCGPTVYDTAHIGNFRTFLFEDLLKRYFLLKGFKVTQVMNLTDVDDRTIERSNRDEIPIGKLTEKYIQLFNDDLKNLKIIPAEYYPKATDHIDGMIVMIKKLIENGFAYITDDKSVYFKIDAYPDYGKLAHVEVDTQQSSGRIVSDHYSKDNPQDFVLWKAWKAGDGKVGWDSPWGRGRPGWHIECSAMSTEYLGDHFDIHCGGVDNIFPHHENEIAQSVCATGKPFVNYWLHSEHLLVDGGKMSKSADNFYKVPDLLEMGFTSEALRYMLASGHYRTNINFSLKKKHEALSVVQRIRDFYDRLSAFPAQGDGELPSEYNDFENALDDDLNMPRALAVFFKWMKRFNSYLDTGKSDLDLISSAIKFVDKFNSIFDLLPEKSEVPPEVIKLVEQREHARADKEWKTADELRAQILELGWVVEDTAGGSKVKPLPNE